MTKAAQLETCLRIAIGDIREAIRYLNSAKECAIITPTAPSGNERELTNIIYNLAEAIDDIQHWAEENGVTLRASMKT